MAKRRWRTFTALVLIIAGLALIAGWGGIKYRRIRTCLDSSMVRLRALQSLVPTFSAQALTDAGAQLHGLQSDIICLRSEGQPFLKLAPWLGWLPGVGPDVASAPHLLEMAQALADGGVLAFDALSPALAQAQAGQFDLPGVIGVLEQSRPALVSAESALAYAAAERAQIDADRLSARVGRLLATTDRALPLLRSGIQAARIAPDLLGGDSPRTYLILAQNDDERRPTGGWISGVGLVTTEGGRVTGVAFRDSYSVDNLAVPHDSPPDALLRTMWAEIWLLRDSNWSPDFPTSAQVAERMLQRDQNLAVDGVIAVDQEALRLLVAAMEPLTLESTTQPVTGANLLQVIRNAWTQPQPGLTPSGEWSDWQSHRKDVMTELVTAMLERVQAQPSTVDPNRLAEALWVGLRERHILIYLHDSEAAALLALLKWDGALLPVSGDYFQLVDANVGFNKVDPIVERVIDYQVDLRDPRQGQVGATVHYLNRSPSQPEPCIQGVRERLTYEEGMVGCYWDYARFYVPEGSQLLERERAPLPSGSLLYRYGFAPPGDAGPDSGPTEKGKMAFGLFFVVPPGEARDVQLRWQLPAGIVTHEQDGFHYRLTVQKQSGTPPILLRVAVRLPPDVYVVKATPEAAAIEVGEVKLELYLATDQQIEIIFR
ncbi:MAG: DUF4012 domain-containing protein [Anaerolineae bacterium]|nr:DUF4012 domain-containing protein [Anaerolineae bacterium]